VERGCAHELEIPQPPAAPPPTSTQALAITDEIGYPVLVRPSTCSAAGPWRSSTTTTTCRAMAELAGFGSLGKEGGLSAERPVLIDRFLEDATEVDVDAIRDPPARC
jgi:carbamoyl-phosphate synthase large subunit